MSKSYNVVAVIQRGRLQFEAALFAASFHHFNPDFQGRLIFAEPQANDKWSEDPTVDNADVRELIERCGGEILPFENEVFGEWYPHGNKIEALKILPAGEPFIFFDTDTLFTGPLSDVPFDFSRPSASMKREGTWPKVELYGPRMSQIWKSLYDRYKMDFQSSLDLTQPEEYWERYLYFNAGWFFGECPRKFGHVFQRYATDTRFDPPEELVTQEFDPWLDQVVLPLVIHRFGGGRHTIPEGLLDGKITCHYRLLPLLYAREPDHVVAALEEVAAPNAVKKVLKQHDAFKKMVYHRKGHKVRDMFDRDNLPHKEQAIRNKIKRANQWVR